MPKLRVSYAKYRAAKGFRVRKITSFTPGEPHLLDIQTGLPSPPMMSLEWTGSYLETFDIRKDYPYIRTHREMTKTAWKTFWRIARETDLLSMKSSEENSPRRDEISGR